MKTVVPNYYEKFSCIASACKHSCCKGWEIDIDEESYELYKTFDGEIGERLNRCISSDETLHFILEEDERCPFLNKDGLCDLIISCGEDALCNICADHPRFRNFFSDRTEIGLGLCCEAAAKLIIECKEPFEIKVIDDDEVTCDEDEEEAELIALRNIAFDIVKDRNFTVEERIRNLLDRFSVKIVSDTPSEWSAFFASLERLDPQWNTCLETLANKKRLEENFDEDIFAENILCYFLFRHMPAALYDGDIPSKIAFAVLSCKVILTLADEFGIEEAARMYSSEIEYSDENLDKIFDYLASGDC